MKIYQLGMSVAAIRGNVENAIHRAAQATGVDFSFLMRTAKRESGFNPSAKAGTSSAAGLFQFVDQTWLSTLKKHGGKYGYGQYADMIGQGSDGRYYVAGGPDARKAVMALKLDPHASALMAGELTAEHAAYLRGRTGRDPTAGELYAAHFLGPAGSARLIEAYRTNPGASAAAMFPDAAAANRSIFYKAGRPASVADVYANLNRIGGSDGIPVDDTPAEPTGFLQYASGRRAELIQQQQELVDLILGGSGGDSSGLRATGSFFSTEMLRALSEDQRRGGGGL